MNGRSALLAALGLVILLGVLGAIVLQPGEGPPHDATPPPPPPPPVAPPSLCPEMQEGAESNAPLATAILLLDASRSFHSGKAGSPFERALETLPRLVTRGILPGADRPHRIGTGTIGSLDLHHSLLCDQTVPRGSVFKRDACSKEQIQASIEACASKVRAQPGESTTDIAGALAYAGTYLGSSSLLARTLVLFSDFEEDLGKKPPATEDRPEARLQGVCAVLFYDFKDNEPAKLNRAQKRAEEWKGRLTKLGVARALVRPVNSFHEGELNGFLHDCWGAASPGLLQRPRGDGP
jgi:hypothetical protein